MEFPGAVTFICINKRNAKGAANVGAKVPRRFGKNIEHGRDVMGEDGTRSFRHRKDREDAASSGLWRARDGLL